jgi:alkanesulfonate monooxygenase
MPVEIVGMIHPRASSDVEAPTPGPAVDVDFLTRFFQAHEAAGFDRVLTVYRATLPDGWAMAQYGTTITKNLKIMLAHRPGFINPTLAARMGATQDQLSGGRFGIHIITGGEDVDQQREGDFLSKPERYARSEEFVEILKQTWTSDKPFDYEGRYYRLKGAFSSVKPVQQPHPTIFFGGSSDEGIEVAAKHADVWAMWCQPVAAVKQRIEDIHARAAPYGRKPGISVSFRPILASTEEKAWARAHAILDRVKALRGDAPVVAPTMNYRLEALKWSEQGDLHDERMWLAIAKATGMATNHTALVGTPEQVADALLAYYDVGVTQMLLRGYEPYEDVIDYGRTLIPLIREGVRLRDMQAANRAAVAAAQPAPVPVTI